MSLDPTLITELASQLIQAKTTTISLQQNLTEPVDIFKARRIGLQLDSLINLITQV